MAPPSLSTPIKSLSISTILFLIPITMVICQANSQGNQTTMVFYLQDVATGTNATAAPVIGINGKVWSYSTFGTIFVVDDPVTLSPNQNSVHVGRAQGLLTAASFDGSNVFVVISIVFNTMQYSGSTLELQGTSRQRENYREISVVSGTGRFRFVRGYAAFETAFYDPATTRSIVRLTITLLQP